MLKGALLGVLIQLECKSPTEDEEEAIFNFVKGHDVFVSLSAGEGKLLCLHQSYIHFDNIRQYLTALRQSVHRLN